MVAFNNYLQSRLKEQTDVATNVYISGRSCKGSNYWLTTPPCAASDSIIESRSFQACLKLHLGLPLIEEIHCPDCNK